MAQKDVATYLGAIRIQRISFFHRQLRATTVQIAFDLCASQPNLPAEVTVSEKDWTTRIDPVSFNSPFHRAVPQVNVSRHRGLEIDFALDRRSEEHTSELQSLRH